MITLEALQIFARKAYPQARIGTVHLLSAWADYAPKPDLSFFLLGTGLDPHGIQNALMPLLQESIEGDDDFLQSCILSAGEGPVTGAHLLLALCRSPHFLISQALTEAGLKKWQVLQRRIHFRMGSREGFLARHGIRASQPQVNPTLLRYGRDLTALAEEGEFEDLCDRPAEIERLLEVLLRKQKGNVALTGPAGVGKTALVELFARRLATGCIPAALAGNRICEVSMGRLVAGTKYRGDFEQRMEEVLKALQDSNAPILFIDEMHLIWGAGRAEDVITDAANLLKPLLARGTTRVIGATTAEEYHRYIARDHALARRFQEVRLSEPAPEETYQMVLSQAASLAAHHNVRISESTIRRAIELTDRHMPNRWQPDKSIDLLDSSAVQAIREDKAEVLESHLLNTLAKQTGRPVSTLTSGDRDSLRSLAGELARRIVGQPQAVQKVAAFLIQQRQDLGDPGRNLGTFLFAGETGVGKTEMAKAVAAVFFRDERALLHLDMAEYNQPGSVNRLIGSPPGYVDSDKEGVLTGWLHAHGSGVILLDEIEKAHPDVHRLILGLLDNGRISSARGEVMDARQCVLVLTTNALTPSDLRKRPIGFGERNIRPDPASLLVAHFPQEFLGRLDEIILFNSLGSEEIRRIMKMRLDEALARLGKKEIRVSFNEERLLALLLSELRDLRSGARGIARLIEIRLLQPISTAVLYREGEGPVHCFIDDEFYEKGTVRILEDHLHKGKETL